MYVYVGTRINGRCYYAICRIVSLHTKVCQLLTLYVYHVQGLMYIVCVYTLTYVRLHILYYTFTEVDHVHI